MKKKLLSLVMAFGIVGFVSAQTTVLFEDDFESYEDFSYTDAGDWTIVNLNAGSPTYGFEGIDFPNSGADHAFLVFNATEAGEGQLVGTGWAARSGEKSMISIADVNAPNDSWLISPQITLGAADNAVSFFARATDDDYGNEEFNILVSNGSTSPADFVQIGTQFISTGTDWVEYTYDLDAYNGEDVYIAIQCISDDQFGFSVDDFKVVGEATASVDDFTAAQFKIHPNPTTDFININNGSELEINEVKLVDIQGRILQTINNDNLNEVQIDVSSLSNGMYFLDMQTDSGKVVKKFLKK